ncbi:hypothetical protein JHK85_033632 [Glycine max]|nr:hypothetical protein JHK85_033632 [Glycine max]
MSSGKRKRDEIASQYNAGGYIPQQDGAGDADSQIFEIEVYGGGISIDAGHSTSNGKMPAHSDRPASQIPQFDGPIPYDDDVVSTPNMYNYGVFNEDYNIANTPASSDVPASTPAPVAQNEVDEEDDDDDEPLNENDDDDDLDDLDQGEDQNTHHLVLAQFDKVTRTKSRWKCTLKDGIMHINNKDILFNKATGEFEF